MAWTESWTGAVPPWVTMFGSHPWGPPATIFETVTPTTTATAFAVFSSPTTLIAAASTQLSSIISPSTTATNPFATSSPVTTPVPSLVTESSIITSRLTSLGTDGSQTVMTTTENVVSVVTALSNPTADPVPTETATAGSHGPNIAAIVGGVLGGILALLLIGGFLYWLFTRRYHIQRKNSPRTSHRSTSSGYLGSETTEIGTTDTVEAYKRHPIYELDGSNATHEVDPSSALYEAVGSPGGAELSDHRNSARNSARNSGVVKDPFSVYFRPPSWMPGDDV